MAATDFVKPRASGSVRTAYWLACVGGIAVLVGLGLGYKQQVAQFLLRRLTVERHLPPASDAASGRVDVVYILGGTVESLEAKFRTGAKLIREGRAARVLVLSQRALMRFDPALGRNLTADEWAVQTLGRLGVGPDAVEAVAIAPGFWGTWSEAKGLSRLVNQRGYRRVVLVTSPYHSRRVWESFSRTVDDADARLFLYVSDEPAYLRHVVPEFFKLLVYRVLLW